MRVVVRVMVIASGVYGVERGGPTGLGGPGLGDDRGRHGRSRRARPDRTPWAPTRVGDGGFGCSYRSPGGGRGPRGGGGCVRMGGPSAFSGRMRGVRTGVRNVLRGGRGVIREQYLYMPSRLQDV